MKKKVKGRKDHIRTNVTLSVRDQVSLTEMIPRMNATAKPKQNSSISVKIMLLKVHKQSQLSNLAKLSGRDFFIKDRAASHHVKCVHKHTAYSSTYGPDIQVV